MRDQTPFDMNSVIAILDRGFNCKNPGKGKNMIVGELLNKWPGDRRAFVAADKGRLYAERRLKVQGRAGDSDRRSDEDRRVA